MRLLSQIWLGLVAMAVIYAMGIFAFRSTEGMLAMGGVLALALTWAALCIVLGVFDK